MRTNVSRTDTVFQDWIKLLGKSDQLSPESKKKLVEHLTAHRRIMIVDVRNFFVDAIKTGDLAEASRYPIAMVSQALPLVVLNSYAEIGEAVHFCESAAMNYDIHCYNPMVFSTALQ